MDTSSQQAYANLEQPVQNEQHMPMNPGASPEYDYLFDSPGPWLPHLFSPSSPHPYHSPFQPPLHQAPPAPSFCATPRPDEDYQSMLQAMKDGDFNIPIFGTAGQMFPHNTSAVRMTSDVQDAEFGWNGMYAQQTLGPGAEILGTPAFGRRNRKRGGGVLSMLLN
ncbi:hypothetical protein PtrARCrB10_10681 [Pyrenophora tritici-repentis]|nr:hypothetical protein PtrARCrB10_10681 [Pyrenophora tritici-repentis]